MPRSFYLAVADALPGFLPKAYRDFSHVAYGRNLKVWFESPPEHYEVQLIGRAALKFAGITAPQGLEIGFHAEHPKTAANDAVLARLGARVVPKAVAGPFIGRPDIATRWRRVSEVWDGPNLQTDEAAIEAAERLGVYIAKIEPRRRRAAAGSERGGS
jgi:hypothetical protein